VELAPLALVYAVMFKREKSPGTILMSGVFVSLISDILTIAGYLYLAKISIIPSIQAVQSQAEQFISIYKSLGMDPEQAKSIVDATIKLTIVLIPSSLAVAAIGRAFLTYLVAVRVLRKLNYTVNPLPPFTEWKIPWYTVWIFIIGLVMSLAGDQYKLTTLANIGKNIIFTVMPLFFIMGVSVATSFFRTRKFPRWIKILLIITTFINLSGTIVLIVLIGLFDPLVSFRRLFVPKDE
jgi:uncharacterized protein YybS (DUF2232 family)